MARSGLKEIGDDFDRSTLARIAPDTDDPWYDLDPVPDIDKSDASLANRKRYVQDRVRRPVKTSAPMPD